MVPEIGQIQQREPLGLGSPTSIAIVCLIVTSLPAWNRLAGQDYQRLTQTHPRPHSDLQPPSVPFDQGPVIPGLQQDAVPQGITYLSVQDQIILSHYFDQAPSRVSFVNNSNGKITSSIATSDGTIVPAWYLDGENHLAEIDLPPMAEGITMIGNRLAVLFESGARKYQSGGKGPLDRVLLLDVGERE